MTATRMPIDVKECLAAIVQKYDTLPIGGTLVICFHDGNTTTWSWMGNGTIAIGAMEVAKTHMANAKKLPEDVAK